MKFYWIRKPDQLDDWVEKCREKEGAPKMSRFQKWVARRCIYTLTAIHMTGNRWRAADRLWLDKGKDYHIKWCRWAGFVTTRKGYPPIGRTIVMVKLTPLGVSVVEGRS